MLTTPNLRASLAGRLAWRPELPDVRRSASPEPGVGALEVPGYTPPVPLQMELSCAAAGLAAKVDSLPVAVRLTPTRSARVPLATTPRSVVARSDGVWVLGDDGLAAVDLDGRTVAEVDVRGLHLVGGLTTRDAVWVLDTGSAVFIGPDGSCQQVASPWRDPSGVVGYRDGLVGWQRDANNQLVALDPDGALRPLAGFKRGEFERLVSFDGETALVSMLRTLRRRGAAEHRLDVLGCGATSTGVFAAVLASDSAWLHTSEGGPVQLAVVDGERVLAVADSRVLVASRTHYRWIELAEDRRGRESGQLALNADSYASEVQPFAWEMATGIGPAAFSPRDIVLSASGPSGLVAVALHWPE